MKKSLKDKAIILYYLNNIKKYLLSEFNPQTISWLKYNIEDLAKSKNVLILKRMIDENKTYLESKLS